MKKSAGLLMYRWHGGSLYVLLGHMGGPFWKNKDDHAWSIPKGECGDDESPFMAAKREFTEETGLEAAGDFRELGEVKQSGGKTVKAWAFEGDCDASQLQSNTFQMEWPPRSGKTAQFPEMDRFAWFGIDKARHKIVKGQLALIDALRETLGGKGAK
ncbi:MAG: NUDIX domain-containing protein [Chitinivibrionales bacterium]|nr:NUDIX domain-containing protein [Chitinivibrionales bacterium]